MKLTLDYANHVHFLPELHVESSLEKLITQRPESKGTKPWMVIHLDFPNN